MKWESQGPGLLLFFCFVTRNVNDKGGEWCDRVSFTEVCDLGVTSLTGRTVVDTFGDRLENFNIERGRATVVPVVLVLVVAGDTVCPFGSRELESGRPGYPGNNLTGIEGENGRVRIDGVVVENFRKIHGLEDRLGKVGSERVFVWTADNTNGTSAPTAVLRMPRKNRTRYISAPLLEGTNHHIQKRDQQDEPIG